ncbi:MAG TPA: DUF2330 domain-containing protein [Nannocystaceae bacterium]|nr:DUF2330 domain-containing protein [Nannocystaceae bacterium]
MARTRIAVIASFVLLAVGMLATQHRPARACGGFFTRSVLTAERRPSLAYEQVLIVHDAAKNREHFIREVAFRKADEPFGFVVPTPARPEVDKVTKSPFLALRTLFPFDPPTIGMARGVIGSGYGSGAGAGFGGRGSVEVLEETKVGSFTAFVLKADDEQALAGWLRDHDLQTTPESEAWLAHYVKLKFFYVAMRYDPPKRKRDDDANAPLAAETIRISFDTPVPFYPYLEPTSTETRDDPRVLDLWMVGTHAVTPIALREQGGEREWIRPLRTGEQKDDVRDQLTGIEPSIDATLPEGTLIVQTFQDQKRSRAGIGDILFAPSTKRELATDDRAALVPLLGILDPALVEGSR